MENKGSDHQGDVLIFRQVLLTSSIRNVWRTVKRICTFIPGLKGFLTGEVGEILVLIIFIHLHREVTSL